MNNTFVLISNPPVDALVNDTPVNCNMYSNVTPVNPSTTSCGRFLRERKNGFFKTNSKKNIIGVAITNRKKPSMIGGISSYTRRTATKLPAQARLANISNPYVKICKDFIKKMKKERLIF
jgi:hypothetical protein